MGSSAAAIRRSRLCRAGSGESPGISAVLFSDISSISSTRERRRSRTGRLRGDTSRYPHVQRLSVTLARNDSRYDSQSPPAVPRPFGVSHAIDMSCGLVWNGLNRVPSFWANWPAPTVYVLPASIRPVLSLYPPPKNFGLISIRISVQSKLSLFVITNCVPVNLIPT